MSNLNTPPEQQIPEDFLRKFEHLESRIQQLEQSPTPHIVAASDATLAAFQQKPEVFQPPALFYPIQTQMILDAYKRNSNKIAHEFNLLHNRVAHFLSVEWMLTAFYVAVLAVTLYKIEITAISIFGLLFGLVISCFGFFSAYDICSGIEEADKAIETYIRNQNELERDDCWKDSILKLTTLGRHPDATGRNQEHEHSLRFHRHIPNFFMILWGVVAVFSLGVAIVKIITQLAPLTSR